MAEINTATYEHEAGAAPLVMLRDGDALRKFAYEGEIHLAEDTVIQVIAASLEARGWSVRTVPRNMPGIDLKAERGPECLVLEAKGEGKYPPMRVNYFLNALGELLQWMDGPVARYGLALPAHRQYVRLATRLPAWVRTRLGLDFYFVRPAEGGGYIVGVADADVTGTAERDGLTWVRCPCCRREESLGVRVFSEERGRPGAWDIPGRQCACALPVQAWVDVITRAEAVRQQSGEPGTGASADDASSRQENRDEEAGVQPPAVRPLDGFESRIEYLVEQYRTDLDRLPSTSAKVRFLFDQGVPRATIARVLKISYQFAWNVIAKYRQLKDRQTTTTAGGVEGAMMC